MTRPITEMKKEDERVVAERPPIATIEGWEDGQPFTRGIHKLDRWALQSADTMIVHIGQHDIVLVQDPHSNYLGGYIWLTSIVFCSYLERLSSKRDRHGWISLDRNKKWVELGSGVGLIGIMLHKLGIENVVITDISELVETMENNVEANNINIKSITGRRKNEKDENYIIVDPLLWNNQQEMSSIKSNLGDEIDYIVACDCIYSEASAIDLIKTMDFLSTDNTTIICISEVRNQQAQDKFMEEAQLIFQVELLPALQWQKKVNHQVDFDETLNLYRLRKQKRRLKSAIKKKK
jgi:predicted nicotinamide N-methyase